MSTSHRETAGLAVEGLNIAFGGNVAVRELSLQAPLGAVTGLIGPNGAGKTTTFNACSGLLRPRSGTVHLLGQDVTRRGAASRARLGLGRTFQRVELCLAMTVRENVALGCEARIIGNSVRRHLLEASNTRRRVETVTDSALARCRIGHLEGELVGSLTTGQRRLVELARVLAGEFRLLLLDEPSSGLDDEETAEFGATVRGAVADLGLGVLLVEHDMQLVMGICEHIFVLDFGELIFDGTPAQVQASQAVRNAYLGSTADADEAAG